MIPAEYLCWKEFDVNSWGGGQFLWIEDTFFSVIHLVRVESRDLKLLTSASIVVVVSFWSFAIDFGSQLMTSWQRKSTMPSKTSL